MKNNFKNFFKLNNWKRWFILIFSFFATGLFVGLSVGLKTNQIKPSTDYANSISLTIKPKDSEGKPLTNESLARQFLFNLKSRIENEYPNSLVLAELQDENIFKIDVTKIDSNNKSSFIEFLTKKEPITIMHINSRPTNNNYFQSSPNNNDIFYQATISGQTISLSSNKETLRNVYDWLVNYNKGLDSTDQSTKAIIWKNYEILKNIVKNDPNGYSGSVYEYLFVDGDDGTGWTPEDYEKKPDGSTNREPIFKDEIVDPISGKKYKPTDFIISKINFDDLKDSSAISLTIEYGVTNYIPSTEDINNLYYDLSYYLSDYSIDNYVINQVVATNGNDAFIFLVIALISIYAVLSIFVVINYGYLGIIAILILALIVFLTMLMLTVFFGDYDSILICTLITSTFVVFEFIVSFYEKIKKEFLKGNSVSKSIKNTTKKTRISMLLKSLILLITFGAFYAIIAFANDTFSLIVLISILAIPILIVPLLMILTNTIVGITRFEDDPKLIGFWNRKYKNVNNKKVNSIEEELDLDETVQIPSTTLNENSNSFVSNYKTKQWFGYDKFGRVSKSSGLKITLATLSYILVFGLIIFLTSFFINGKTLKSGFNISDVDKNQIVLKVSNTPNSEQLSLNEQNEIKNIFVENGIEKENIEIIDNVIQVKIDNTFSTEIINDITNQIYNLYNVVIVTSSLESSNTFELMKFTMYAALAAMIAMCIFVLFWMGWSKALALLISSIITYISFIFMVGFGLIQINAMLAAIAAISLLLFLFSSINVLTKVHYKFKKLRIEEQMTNDIKDLVYKQTFKSLKPLLITNGFVIISFIIFIALFKSLPILPMLFIIGFALVNLIYTIFLLPRLIIWLESSRAKMKRKVILENYWDTEKVKEQSFKGLNNIK